MQEASTKRIELPDDNPAMVKRMLEVCYGTAYSEEADRTHDPPSAQRAHIHAGMYILADKVEMEGLKDYAKKRFTIIMDLWMKYKTIMRSLPRLVSLVYSSTPETDRTLRDAVAAYAQTKWQALSTELDMKTLLAENPDFAFDILNSMHKRFIWDPSGV